MALGGCGGEPNRSGGDDCERGTERCACFENGTCFEGLTCLSNFCVDDDGAGEAGEPDGSAGAGALDARGDGRGGQDNGLDASNSDRAAGGARVGSGGTVRVDDGGAAHGHGGAGGYGASDGEGAMDSGAGGDRAAGGTGGGPLPSLGGAGGRRDAPLPGGASGDAGSSAQGGSAGSGNQPAQGGNGGNGSTGGSSAQGGAAGSGIANNEPGGDGGFSGQAGSASQPEVPLPTLHTKFPAPRPVTVTGTLNQFGRAVALSGDTLAVAANDDELGNGIGAVFVYVLQDGAWELDSKVLPALADGTLDDAQINILFGNGLALSGDTLLAGAAGSDGWAGAAYVYERIDGSWQPRGKLSAVLPDGTEDRQDVARFGSHVAISGDTLAIGAGGYRHEDGTRGIVYVFTRDGDTWEPQARLAAQLPDGTPDGRTDSNFGQALTLSGDTIAVGDSEMDTDIFNTGCVYTYVRSGGSWSPEAKVVARTEDGNLDPSEFLNFGVVVHLVDDTLFVSTEANYDGMSAAGSVYVFTRRNGEWSPEAKLLPRLADGSLDAYAFGQFGHPVAFSGSSLAVGAVGDDDRGYDVGAVYLYERRETQWLPRGKVLAQSELGHSEGRSGDAFGSALALDGGHLAVGARGYDEPRTDAGSVYVFAMP